MKEFLFECEGAKVSLLGFYEEGDGFGEEHQKGVKKRDYVYSCGEYDRKYYYGVWDTCENRAEERVREKYRETLMAKIAELKRVCDELGTFAG